MDVRGIHSSTFSIEAVDKRDEFWIFKHRGIYSAEVFYNLLGHQSESFISTLSLALKSADPSQVSYFLLPVNAPQAEEVILANTGEIKLYPKDQTTFSKTLALLTNTKNFKTIQNELTLLFQRHSNYPIFIYEKECPTSIKTQLDLKVNNLLCNRNKDFTYSAVMPLVNLMKMRAIAAKYTSYSHENTKYTTTPLNPILENAFQKFVDSFETPKPSPSVNDNLSMPELLNSPESPASFTSQEQYTTTETFHTEELLTSTPITTENILNKPPESIPTREQPSIPQTQETPFNPQVANNFQMVLLPINAIDTTMLSALSTLHPNAMVSLLIPAGSFPLTSSSPFYMFNSTEQPKQPQNNNMTHPSQKISASSLMANSFTNQMNFQNEEGTNLQKSFRVKLAIAIMSKLNLLNSMSYKKKSDPTITIIIAKKKLTSKGKTTTIDTITKIMKDDVDLEATISLKKQQGEYYIEVANTKDNIDKLKEYVRKVMEHDYSGPNPNKRLKKN